MFGKRKMINPSTGYTKYVSKDQIQEYLDNGFVFSKRSHK